MNKQIVEYVRRFGDGNQKERVAAGISLTDRETDAIVYKAIWKEFFGWFKRKRMTEEEVRKIAVMHRQAQWEDPVSFEQVEPADQLTDKQWTALKALRRLAQQTFDAKVVPFWIIGHCGKKHLKKAFGRVEIWIDDRPYQISLSLELPRHPGALARALELLNDEGAEPRLSRR